MDQTVTARIRLYVDHPLGEGQSVAVSRDQAHYLFGVMRLGVGAMLRLFNGHDGEWLAEVVEAGKRGGVLAVHHQSAPQVAPPDLWLLFAPVKKARTDFIVEKAVEMGVARILPVQTDHTNSARVQRERLQAHAVEAAEQCGATHVPEVSQMQPLDRLLSGWQHARRILFCDETRAGEAAHLDDLAPGPWAILIGPEGGFSDAERARLQSLPFAHAVSLGPRILRADTAAVAALALWQQALGDWR
jgi:16S rRNA (uracil1498-N3)-methyltransferase